MSVEQLFFELVRVALGTQDMLTRTPSAKEWKALYDMAKKQSLIGVCFAGLQRLCDSEKEDYCGMNEMLYLTWMGMAAKIQQRNEDVNAQCVELQERLSEEGFKSCILKGQGVAQLYPENLKCLRQSGDIDVWIDAPMADIIRYARAINHKAHFDYLHVDLDVFKDTPTSSAQVTEVEAHYRPGCMYNLRKNRKLQKWFKENKQTQTLLLLGGEIEMPSVEFNLFYILHHAYRHLINGGIGLRQVMDWYFVLKSRNNANDDDNDNFLSLLKQFGIMRFAKAVMWIILNVFENGASINSFDTAQDRRQPSSIIPIEPDEKEGSFLLNEIMMGGNFGHHDNRKEKHKANESKWEIFVRKAKMNIHLQTHYPSEVLSAPIYFVWHYFWKKKQIYLLQ